MSNGLRYTLPREKIIEYMRLSPEEKLMWLEDIFLFTIACQNETTKKIREHFRREDNSGDFL